MGKRIVVVGAGAVGGYVGAHLTAGGHDVTLIDPWPEHVETMKANGMEIFGMTPEERTTVKVNAIHLTEVQQLAKQKPIDIAFISVKSYDTVWATQMIAQYLSSTGCVVSMQNCINEERVAGVVGWGRTLGCIVTGGVGVDLYQPGHIRRGSAKRADITTFYIGEPDFKYWTDDAIVPANYPVRDKFLAQARKNLLPVKERIHFYKDNEEIIPGVTALAAPGHTVSHSIFMINSGGQQIAYIGDLAHHPVLLLEKPRTQFAFDTDPVQSAESRVKMLTMLAANRTPILAYHFAWPGIGHVAKAGDGFRYFPEPAQMEGVSGL